MSTPRGFATLSKIAETDALDEQNGLVEAIRGADATSAKLAVVQESQDGDNGTKRCRSFARNY